jgi:hypothetical protein
MRLPLSVLRLMLDQPGFHCDGAGLYLQVARDEEGRATGGASYVYRHKTKWASIGSANVYSIKEARETAAKLWTAAGRKEDPIALLRTLRGSPTAATGKISRREKPALGGL